MKNISMRSHKSSFSPSTSKVHNRRHSHSPQFSPNRKPPKLTTEQIVEEIRKTAEKVNTQILASNIIKQTNESMRCLNHNSVLSMYCENEQKLLCANCLFRNHTHKLHKVYPIQKCYKLLTKDVNELSVQNEKYLILVQNTIRSLNEQIQNQQILASKSLIKLAKQYDQLHHMLTVSFQNARKKLALGIEDGFISRRKIIVELEKLRGIIECNRIKKVQNEQIQTSEIPMKFLTFQHFICKSLLQTQKLSLAQIISNQPNYVRLFERKQLDKVCDVKDILNRWKSYQETRQITIMRDNKNPQVAASDSH